MVVLRRPITNISSRSNLISPYGDYQRPPAPYNDYQQQAPAPYNDYQQQAPAPYNDYQQQAPAPYGNYQPSYTGTQPGGYSNPGISGVMNGPVNNQPKPSAMRMWGIIAVVVIVVLAASGLLIHFAFSSAPPLMPTITVTSDYHDNSGLPAGAAGTRLTVKGQKFANSSTVTFLLDGGALPGGGVQAMSDATGNVTASLSVTSDWAVGPHTLTARDASNNTTATAISLKIVNPGEANTPGPNGAPANDATFNVDVNAQMQDDSDNSHFAVNFALNVKNGTVCSPGDDGSSQQNQVQDSSGTTYDEVSTYSCSGTYSGGKITYNETLLTRKYSDAAGDSCVLNTPQSPYTQVTGTYNNQNEFSGTVTLSSIDPTQFTCQNLTYTPDSATGQWTGSATAS